jgi:hypothetical protein
LEQPTGTSQTAPPAAAATATAAAAATQQGGRPPAAALDFLQVLMGKLQGRSEVMADRMAVMEDGLHKVSCKAECKYVVQCITVHCIACALHSGTFQTAPGVQ